MTLSCRVLPRVLSGEPTRPTRYLQNHPRSTPRDSQITTLPSLRTPCNTVCVSTQSLASRVQRRADTASTTDPKRSGSGGDGCSTLEAALVRGAWRVLLRGSWLPQRAPPKRWIKDPSRCTAWTLGHRSTRLISCVAALRSGSA